MYLFSMLTKGKKPSETNLRNLFYLKLQDDKRCIFLTVENVTIHNPSND